MADDASHVEACGNFKCPIHGDGWAKTNWQKVNGQYFPVATTWEEKNYLMLVFGACVISKELADEMIALDKAVECN